MQFTVHNVDELESVAKKMVENTGPHTVWAFYGEMGAGKTTLIQRICKALGVTQQVSSPTFNLINEYDAGAHKMVYHFDYYRLNDIDEAFNIGTLEYVDSGHLCLIEWPEKAESLLPENRRNVTITVEGDTKRQIKISDYD
ncbi:MAG: tRNA (adenosine(37)-N6)-threonylcarbamoyltransferase complex ATPase subunit type 1 TsaE [Salinivirgaceae bacterium]|jgi:tRNA threonylcarbamoyladenosine biosynthesis protein TsaE|nr:tRNA (adenosine(37)-N6)-threonylcarbamoyltransferase complex ATPase subunit type 1 TsaE [Salinivirgaceae bacterium]